MAATALRRIGPVAALAVIREQVRILPPPADPWMHTAETMLMQALPVWMY